MTNTIVTDEIVEKSARAEWERRAQRFPSETVTWVAWSDLPKADRCMICEDVRHLVEAVAADLVGAEREACAKVAHDIGFAHAAKRVTENMSRVKQNEEFGASKCGAEIEDAIRARRP